MKEHTWVLLNGQRQLLPIDGRRLIDWLRDDMGLTGTKVPCGAGHCGGCSILLDSEVVLSCCMLASSAAGRQLITIEGIADITPEDPLLDAFVRFGATQCGYCTPGMIIAARAFLNICAHDDSKEQLVDEQAVRLALSGNICRCTGYVQIVNAVLSVAQQENRNV
jgi:aerobic-type carbon monoxide dehydrogenase small subunit (CoxS/CutS family)